MLIGILNLSGALHFIRFNSFSFWWRVETAHVPFTPFDTSRFLLFEQACTLMTLPIAPTSPSSEGSEPGQESFDQKRLIELVDGDTGLLREIIDLFLEDAPGWVDSIREAIANQDGEALRGGAHALKGAVSNFAADRVGSTALAMEEFGRKGDLSGAEAALPALEAQMLALTDDLALLASEQR